MPVFQSHHKNLINIEYNFELSITFIDSLIKVFTEAILSFIRLLLIIKLLGKGGLTDSATAIELLYLLISMAHLKELIANYPNNYLSVR